MQLSFELDTSAKASLQTQLVGEITTSITSGRLTPGTRLPGTRSLSQQLGVSRNTVLLAFSALEAEGFIESREGAGTFVSAYWPEPAPFQETGPATPPVPSRPATAEPEVTCDFQLEAVDPDLFPTATWRRLMMRRMQSPDFNLSRTGDPRGAPDLRKAICRFLGASRSMKIDPEQVLIVSSIQQATNVVGQMFVSPGSPVVVERPGCSLIAPIYARAGAEILPVPTDHDGLRVDLLPQRRNALVAVTPERQFPMGASLSTTRRKALLDWAEHTDAHVFEVDFDSEFRYEGSPKPALQSLDRHGRFIYSAAFALTIGPGLRIGFLVLPPRLVAPAMHALRLLDHAYPCQTQGAPWLDQAVLCDFLESGGYEKHLRRLRKTYMARRNALMDALTRWFGPCDLGGTASGTHLVWRLPAHLPDAGTCQALAGSVGIRVNTMMLETVTGPEYLPDWNRYLLLGYADLPEDKITAAVARLAGALLPGRD
ncbi:MAG: PLP-dependent aminotransferase family protein [Rhodobacteraceae bacterium]|nr:PLP-dependent aminotransferase family protein [Paracoccaceae bacterium]